MTARESSSVANLMGDSLIFSVHLCCRKKVDLHAVIIRWQLNRPQHLPGVFHPHETWV
jgi:hypothetical protein